MAPFSLSAAADELETSATSIENAGNCPAARQLLHEQAIQAAKEEGIRGEDARQDPPASITVDKLKEILLPMVADMVKECSTEFLRQAANTIKAEFSSGIEAIEKKREESVECVVKATNGHLKALQTSNETLVKSVNEIPEKVTTLVKESVSSQVKAIASQRLDEYEKGWEARGRETGNTARKHGLHPMDSFSSDPKRPRLTDSHVPTASRAPNSRDAYSMSLGIPSQVPDTFQRTFGAPSPSTPFGQDWMAPRAPIFQHQLQSLTPRTSSRSAMLSNSSMAVEARSQPAVSQTPMAFGAPSFGTRPMLSSLNPQIQPRPSVLSNASVIGESRSTPSQTSMAPGAPYQTRFSLPSAPQLPVVSDSSRVAKSQASMAPRAPAFQARPSEPRPSLAVLPNASSSTNVEFPPTREQTQIAPNGLNSQSQPQNPKAAVAPTVQNNINEEVGAQQARLDSEAPGIQDDRNEDPEALLDAGADDLIDEREEIPAEQLLNDNPANRQAPMANIAPEPHPNPRYGAFSVRQGMRDIPQKWMRDNEWPEPLIVAICVREKNLKDHWKASAKENTNGPSLCWTTQFNFHTTDFFGPGKISIQDKRTRMAESWNDREHECPACAYARGQGKEVLCFFFERNKIGRRTESHVVVLPPQPENED